MIYGRGISPVAGCQIILSEMEVCLMMLWVTDPYQFPFSHLHAFLFLDLRPVFFA